MAAVDKASEKQDAEMATAKAKEPKGLLKYVTAAAKYILDLMWVHWFLVGLGVAIGAPAQHFALFRYQTESASVLNRDRHLFISKVPNYRSCGGGARRGEDSRLHSLRVVHQVRFNGSTRNCSVVKHMTQFSDLLCARYGAVIIIFLLSGMGLKTRVLMNAAAAWRLHIVRTQLHTELPETWTGTESLVCVAVVCR